jgi:hypothetical protein
MGLVPSRLGLVQCFLGCVSVLGLEYLRLDAWPPPLRLCRAGRTGLVQSFLGLVESFLGLVERVLGLVEPVLGLAPTLGLEQVVSESR